MTDAEKQTLWIVFTRWAKASADKRNVLGDMRRLDTAKVHEIEITRETRKEKYKEHVTNSFWTKIIKIKERKIQENKGEEKI